LVADDPDVGAEADAHVDYCLQRHARAAAEDQAYPPVVGDSGSVSGKHPRPPPA